MAICGYDPRLTGVAIALQDDNWQELLEGIDSSQLRRNTAHITWKIREALGKDFEYAKEISDGQPVS